MPIAKKLCKVSRPDTVYAGSKSPSMKNKFFLIVTACAVFLTAQSPIQAAAPIPVVLITDLWHPHIDYDDHFDAATMYCLPGIDLKAVIIDQTKGAAAGQGLPVKQLNALSGRSVPIVMGALRRPMKSPSDTLDDDDCLDGVRFILKTLQDSSTPVVLVTVASCRDLAAAFNRNPGLFREKAGKIYVFAGNGKEGEGEYNVGLDAVAYGTIMGSGLSIYWVPCYDGNPNNPNNPQGKHCSYWQSKVSDVLTNASEGLWKYFNYMWQRYDPATKDPLLYLSLPIDPNDRNAALSNNIRQLWCTAVFADITGRRFVYEKNKNKYFSIDSTAAIPGGCVVKPAYDWIDIDIEASAGGGIQYRHSASSTKVKQFNKTDMESYSKAMTEVTADLLKASQSWPKPMPAPPAGKHS